MNTVTLNDGNKIPAVNQVECNPFFQQRELRAFLDKDNVRIEAYQPLGHGNSALLTHSAITGPAENTERMRDRSSSDLNGRMDLSYFRSPRIRSGSQENRCL